MRRYNLGRMLARTRPRTPAGASRTRRPPRYRPAVSEFEARVVPSVTIAINYAFDASPFFDTQAKRDLMQQAADAVASALNDSLAAITPGGGNTWSADFPDP